MGFDRTDSAFYLANQLAKNLSRALQKRASALGFSPGQFPVLLALWEEDGLTQRQLLDRLEVEQATLANTLARMERDGLIIRTPHPTDRRAQIIVLTERGRELEALATDAAAEAEDQMFQGFRRFERELLKEYMRMAILNGRASLPG
ncbi:MarR family winged helix-turn-helix transcriptional regulator [Rhizobium sp. SSA_523]|uniref:MarR family winged helix-turn-helix transcriptional regulator n=1 Tax=Rhizobium sp. SSA_523 TaxID=2952477 RepID=UPI0020913155|nr:MarR family transcriptional regulator [Rhizobium sp. SSA_523]MCO5732841.1 MarR family transcriptional regulator [Rhizobium sp. SSA_523]WKC23542.1 MarR family transcriptional regulator [Rhizobium sp. SSA_523]